MGSMLSWLGKPSGLIPDESWNPFLDKFAAIFLAVVVTTTLLTLFIYNLSAKHRKVFSVNDVFAPYTPMYWIMLAVPGSIVAFILCIVGYPVEFALGGLGFSFEILFLGITLIALLSYLAILFVPPLTPARFRYRPAPYRYKRKLASR